MKQFLILLSMAICLMFVVFVHAEELTFEWDANTEFDLAGYRLYQSDTPDGQVIGGELSPNFVVSIPIGTETVTITIEPVTDVTLYWILTAYDNGHLESGKSNEVSHYFNKTAPVPPGTLQKTNVQAANVYINGDVNVAEANVETLRIMREVTEEGD